MSKYNICENIGEGAYAKVFKAYLIEDTKKLFPLAIKQIIPDNEEKKTGFQINAIREIYTLRRADHPNIMKLYDVYIKDGLTNLVYEYLDVTLEKIIKKFEIKESQAKTYFKMLIQGVNYLHNTLYILHLDIAPKNLLISYNPDTRESTLKLVDFGLSYPYSTSRYAMSTYQNSSPLNPLTSPPELMEPTAVTYPYRAPELLYGATQYGPPADMWSCGCVFAEILLGKTLFLGPDVADQNRVIANQKQLISARLGAPNDTVWPGFSALNMSNSDNSTVGRQTQQRTLQSARMGERGKGFLELDPYKSKKVISALLSYDPSKRPTANGLLSKGYFEKGCCSLNELPFFN